MKLYDYYRSTASYRVRIALNIKKMSYESIPVHLIHQGGEHHFSEYLHINPQGLVPTLNENGHIISQSLAIIEYLDEISPTPPLLPATPLARAQVRSMALFIACDMHPLNNLRVLQQLRSQFQADEHAINNWYHHWLKQGFDAFEAQLQAGTHKSKVCYGHEISLADLCLIPQVYNAKRYQFSMEAYPLIQEIVDYCNTLSAFSDAAPSG